ncbi:MAG: FecR domain-containing protein [Verrucomicrobiales bacterium]
MTDPNRDHLLELADAYVENVLDADQVHELESWLERDGEARAVFVDYLHAHAALHWEQIGEIAPGRAAEFSATDRHRDRVRAARPLWIAAAAVAVISLVALSWVRRSTPPAAFATMEHTEAARWESGDLPTADGARLGAGRLRLAEGLATISFDSGAEVVLEAPAELELVDGTTCVLSSGTAVAEVAESAHGFTIDTPTAHVIDHGTRFAVNVNSTTGATQTQVFDGAVDVELPTRDRSVRLHSGEHNFVAGDHLGEVSVGPIEATWTLPSGGKFLEEDWQILTTVAPGADDGYVSATFIEDHTSEDLLLLKNSVDPEGPHRKAFVRFDLGHVDTSAIEDAELILHFTPTGWGLASLLDDSEFEVYGLLDSSLDSWEAEQLTWENAPGNDSGSGNALQPEKVVSLGSFIVPRGVQSGPFGISGTALTEFLKADRDRLSTLIVVRNTVEHRGGGLVHGISSSRHSTLPPPKLAVKVGR